MDEHSDSWERDRRYLEKFGEAIDQLSRVSHNLQRGVLDTRMVPVGPLFNRFRRVVRDLSKERDKKVDLSIRGENTELDKRMIDELGDPLVHLVRNSIDHGLEAPALRVSRDKPEAGTIYLEGFRILIEADFANDIFIILGHDKSIADSIGAVLIDVLRNLVGLRAIKRIFVQQFLVSSSCRIHAH